MTWKSSLQLLLVYRANAESRRCKVGRAVHCTPGLVVQTQLVRLNLVFRALTGAATFNG